MPAHPRGAPRRIASGGVATTTQMLQQYGVRIRHQGLLHGSRPRSSRPPSSPRSRPFRTVGDRTARARAGNDPDREGLCRSGRARCHRSRPTRPRSDRATARASSPRPGPIRPSAQALLDDATPAIAALGYASRGRRASRRGREHAAAPQHGRLHAVLLLPVGSARAAAGLVQVRALSLARGERPARRAAPISASACRRTPRSGCGIRPRKSVIWCCRCGPQAPKAGARSNSPNS